MASGYAWFLVLCSVFLCNLMKTLLPTISSFVSNVFWIYMCVPVKVHAIAIHIYIMGVIVGYYCRLLLTSLASSYMLSKAEWKRMRHVPCVWVWRMRSRAIAAASADRACVVYDACPLLFPPSLSCYLAWKNCSATVRGWGLAEILVKLVHIRGEHFVLYHCTNVKSRFAVV